MGYGVGGDGPDAIPMGVPVSAQAKALAEMGQFAIACRPHNDRLWDMLAAYGNEMYQTHPEKNVLYTPCCTHPAKISTLSL